MSQGMLEQETVLIDLGIEEAEKIMSGDDIIRLWRWAIVDIVGIVEIPLVPLLVYLRHHT